MRKNTHMFVRGTVLWLMLAAIGCAAYAAVLLYAKEYKNLVFRLALTNKVTSDVNSCSIPVVAAEENNDNVQMFVNCAGYLE